MLHKILGHQALKTQKLSISSPLLRRIQTWLTKKRDAWLKKRIPPDNLIQLNINNTFILPSTFGWACIGIVLCLFILGTNFQNNIILLFCYFLLAILLLSVFHAFFYFVQHTIRFMPIEADFENRQVYLPLEVTSTSRYQGGALYFYCGKKGVSYQQSKPKCSVKVPLAHYTRGIHECPRVSLVSTYGFGLFKCWTHLSPKLSFAVYPSPKKSAIKLRRASEDAELLDSSDSQYAISDNLQGIREYQPTDPIHHVSWKHVAKGQGMLTKDFNENVGVSGWLKIQDLLHLGTEDALRCLCYQIQQMDKDHVQFGLDLGSTKILPQKGPQHLRDCLLHLASFAQVNTLLSEENEELSGLVLNQANHQTTHSTTPN